MSAKKKKQSNLSLIHIYIQGLPEMRRSRFGGFVLQEKHQGRAHRVCPVSQTQGNICRYVI